MAMATATDDRIGSYRADSNGKAEINLFQYIFLKCVVEY